MRIRPLTFWVARKKIAPFAALLLQTCRDIPSTTNELRWIRQHIAATPSKIPSQLRLRRLCAQRAKGFPLQYILGTQPFGHLEILCRPGVLIPRLETESYTLRLASLVTKHLKSLPSSSSQSINIIDICTGTGCIPLQLYSSLSRLSLPISVHGVDISPRALSLARKNLMHNFSLSNVLPPSQNHSIAFQKADVFSSSFPALVSSLLHPSPISQEETQLDILISNPPYISRTSFSTTTTRSVRNYEPRLALVPDQEEESVRLQCEAEDVFYARLLEVVRGLHPRPPRYVFFEVAGWEQAERVAGMVERDEMLRGWYKTMEVWRDWPDGEVEIRSIEGRDVKVRGDGEARSICLCRHEEGR